MEERQKRKEAQEAEEEEDDKNPAEVENQSAPPPTPEQKEEEVKREAYRILEEIKKWAVAELVDDIIAGLEAEVEREKKLETDRIRQQMTKVRRVGKSE